MLIAREDFCTRPVCVYISVPAFTLPPHGLRRRPRRLRHSAAAVIHNGLSTEKLSTSLLAALCKTFSSSRLRTRIYNISFARRPLPGVSAPLWGRGRAVAPPWPASPSAGWGRAKAKAGCSPRAVPRTCPPKTEPLPAYGRITCAKAEVHKVIPAPARAFSPRQPAYGRALVRLWAKCRAFSPRQLVYGRALCPLMGVAPCVLPATARIRPNPCPLMGEVPSAKAEVHKAIPASARLRPSPCPLMGEVPSAGWGGRRQRRTPPRAANRTFPAYRRAPAA